MKRTIFMGNGFNRCRDTNKSWDDLLASISSEYNVIPNGEIDQKLYTFFYERIVLSDNHNINIKKKEESIKINIAKEMDIMPIDLYTKLLDLDTLNFITTNYDYCIEKTYENDKYKIENSDSSESIYSIRRYIELGNIKKHKVKIWHVHGEVKYPKSIMLGLDHYCGSIGKMDSYIKGTYNFQKNGQNINTESIKDKLSGDCDFDGHSWIELFFNTDVHIVGFGMDYSETDLWWILNKRARILKEIEKKELKKSNSIYFYGDIDSTKSKLLQDFGVIVVEVKVNGDDYYAQNIKIIEEMRRNYI